MPFFPFVQFREKSVKSLKLIKKLVKLVSLSKSVLCGPRLHLGWPTQTIKLIQNFRGFATSAGKNIPDGTLCPYVLCLTT
jgi:hypothetical protein